MFHEKVCMNAIKDTTQAPILKIKIDKVYENRKHYF